jgi:Domain of unknown function (DUF4276)
LKQLNVFCEGQTEQGFCTQVLQPHLFPQGDGLIHTLAVGAKDHHHVYGLGTKKKYSGAKGVGKFIQNTIKGRNGKNVYFTTLFDVYGLPDDFPGKAANLTDRTNPTFYVVALESAFGSDINYYRFIPNLVLHEYETILFSDPEAFRRSFENCEEEIQELKRIAASEPSIEHINDGKDTAPSKRIIALIPEYAGRKSSAGPDIAAHIGLPTIRAKCPHIHEWLNQLERIPWET